MSRKSDLTGKRFGKLVAKYPTEKRVNKRIVWQCECDCGNTAEVTFTALKSGETKSCGCLREKNLREYYDPSSLFLGKEPRKDFTTGYRGVSRYLTRKSKERHENLHPHLLKRIGSG